MLLLYFQCVDTPIKTLNYVNGLKCNSKKQAIKKHQYLTGV
ncbi:hypothetical protein FM107_05845 [Sphingobacterium sp. JB170]|nr:hypothetical protein FM107_05845 [Sphingobacterium sp. JB170]